jgi:hypothetical protein
VLEQSRHFFLLEMGVRTDKLSTLRLKAAHTTADMEPAKPPCRPRCAGATCPRTSADTAGAAATGDLQPSADNATNNIINVHIGPPASQHLAAKPTQTLSLPPQSLGGGPVVAYCLFPLRFPR